MRMRIKHILTLCLLLLISNNSMFAHTPAKSFISVQTSIQDEAVFTKNIQLSDLTDITTPTKETEAKKEIITDYEEEDSEILSSKKQLEKTISYIAFSSTLPPSFLTNYNYNSLAKSFCKAFFYLPSFTSLYIIFEVFRI